jgi:glycosyltransferase involved in cell wall biosynthesis
MIFKPSISVIIPVYNRSNLIYYTLDSVLKQTYSSWECIIIDDGSTDKTQDIVEAFCEKDNRFIFFNRPNIKPKGANACRNYGLELSIGDYIIFLDSDDLLTNIALEDRLNHMEEGDFDMVVTHSRAFKQNVGDMDLIWNKLFKDETNDDLLIRFFNSDMPWCTNSVTWSRKFMKKVEGWDESLCAWQDWEIHVRALFLSPRIKYADEIDNYFRYSGHESIGSSYRSKPYFNSLNKVVINVDRLLRNNNIDNEDLLRTFKYFVVNKIIFLPLIRGHLFLPLRLMKKVPFIKGINRFNFLKIYIMQLMCKSYKLRKYMVGKLSNKQQEAYKLISTHLKYTRQDL